MNKKALLKEIRKHPDGSKMLSLGYSPSFIHKMIIEADEQMPLNFNPTGDNKQKTNQPEKKKDTFIPPKNKPQQKNTNTNKKAEIPSKQSITAAATEGNWKKVVEEYRKVLLADETYGKGKQLENNVKKFTQTLSDLFKQFLRTPGGANPRPLLTKQMGKGIVLDNLGRIKGLSKEQKLKFFEILLIMTKIRYYQKRGVSTFDAEAELQKQGITLQKLANSIDNYVQTIIGSIGKDGTISPEQAKKFVQSDFYKNYFALIKSALKVSKEGFDQSKVTFGTFRTVTYDKIPDNLKTELIDAYNRTKRSLNLNEAEINFEQIIQKYLDLVKPGGALYLLIEKKESVSFNTKELSDLLNNLNRFKKVVEKTNDAETISKASQEVTKEIDSVQSGKNKSPTQNSKDGQIEQDVKKTFKSVEDSNPQLPEKQSAKLVFKQLSQKYQNEQDLTTLRSIIYDYLDQAQGDDFGFGAKEFKYKDLAKIANSKIALRINKNFDQVRTATQNLQGLISTIGRDPSIRSASNDDLKDLKADYDKSLNILLKMYKTNIEEQVDNKQDFERTQPANNALRYLADSVDDINRMPTFEELIKAVRDNKEELLEQAEKAVDSIAATNLYLKLIHDAVKENKPEKANKATQVYNNEQEKIEKEGPSSSEKSSDDQKFQNLANELVSQISQQGVGLLNPDVINNATNKDDPEAQEDAVSSLGQAAPEDDKFNNDDVQKLNNPDTQKQAADNVNKTFQQKQQDAGEKSKKQIPNEMQPLLKKFYNFINAVGIIKESVENILKAFEVKDLENTIKDLDGNFEPEEVEKLKNFFSDNEYSLLFINQFFNNHPQKEKIINTFKSLANQKPTEQEPKANEEELNKEASVDYAKAFEKFEKDFLTKTFLKDQGNVFNDLFAIVAQISGKEVDEFDQEELALTDRNPEAGDAEPMKEGKEDVIQLYQQSLIPQTNKMQRNTDKIMDILNDYDEYLNGNLKGGLKRGSKSLFQKYGEMNPRKLLFNVLRTTMKDIATLEDLLDEYEANFDQDEKEEKPQEKLQENQDLADLPVREKVAKVKEVYQRVISKEGLAIYNRLKTTDPTRKDREDREQVGMEEQIIKEVFRLLKEEEGGDQQNIRELCGVVYDVMVPIRVFFPNVSPFGTKYQVNQAVSGLKQTLKNFARIVLAINNTAKDKRILRDTSELRSKLIAIENNLQKYFGVEKFKRMSKVAAVNDEGQKAAEEGKAEDTDEFLNQVTDSDTLTANQKLPGFDGLVQQILSGAYTDDDVINILAEFFESPAEISKIKKGFNFIKSKLGLNENEVNENEIKETYFKFMKLVLTQLLSLQTMKGQPKIKDEIRKKMLTIASNRLYTKTLDYMNSNTVISAQKNLSGFEPKEKFKQYTEIKATDLRLMFKNFKRLYNKFRGQDKFKGVFVLYNLVQTIMLADVANPDFDMGADPEAKSKKGDNEFLNKYSGGDREKLKILQLFFDVYKPEDFSDVEQDFKDPSKLEEQIIDSVIRILLREREDKIDADFLDKVKGVIDEDVAKRVLEDYKRFILKTKEIKDNPKLKKWLLSTLIQMATKDTSEFIKLLKPSDSDVYDQVTKEVSLEDAIKDVSKQNKKMAKLLNQFFNQPKDQEEGGDEDLPQNVQSTTDKYRRKIKPEQKPEEKPRVSPDAVNKSDVITSAGEEAEREEEDNLEEELRVSGFKERGDERESEFFGHKTFKLDKIKQILLNSGELPNEVKDYTINYFEKTKLDKKDKNLLMYGISIMLKDYKELFVKTLSSIPSLKRATAKREMTEKQEEALKFFFSAYNNYKSPGSEERDTDVDAMFTTPGIDNNNSFTRSTPKPKGEPESLEPRGKKAFQENKAGNLTELQKKKIKYALGQVKEKYGDEIFKFVNQEIKRQVQSGEFLGKSVEDAPDAQNVQLDNEETNEEDPVVQQFVDRYGDRVDRVRNFIQNNREMRGDRGYDFMTYAEIFVELGKRYNKIRKDIGGEGLENPERQIDRFEKFLDEVEGELEWDYDFNKDEQEEPANVGDDEEETQGLNKYVKSNLEKEVLEEFFRIMKQLNESFVTDFLQASGNDRQLNSKVANALGKMKDILSDDDQLKWLKTTLIKMVKEDRDLFNQQAGIASDKPEQDSEKAKENQEEFMVNAITQTWEEFNSEDYDNEDFPETFADEAVKNADPFLTPDEARSIDPNAVINRPEVQDTFDQYSNETGNDFNSEEFLSSLDYDLDNNIDDEIHSEQTLKRMGIPTDEVGEIDWSEEDSWEIPTLEDEAEKGKESGSDLERLKVGDVYEYNPVDDRYGAFKDEFEDGQRIEVIEDLEMRNEYKFIYLDGKEEDVTYDDVIDEYWLQAFNKVEEKGKESGSDLEQKVIEEFKVEVGYQPYDDTIKALQLDFKEIASGDKDTSESEMSRWADSRLNPILSYLAQHFQEEIYEKTYKQIKDGEIGKEFTQEYLKERAAPWVKQSILDMFPNWIKWLDNNGLENWKYHLKYLDIPLGEDLNKMGHETVGMPDAGEEFEDIVIAVQKVGFKRDGAPTELPEVIIGG